MEKRLFALTLTLVLGTTFLVGIGRDSADDPGDAAGGRTLIRNASMVLTVDPAR